jgi:hypothetical protein
MMQDSDGRERETSPMAICAQKFPRGATQTQGGGEWAVVEGEENPNELQWPITGVVRRQLLGPI